MTTYLDNELDRHLIDWDSLNPNCQTKTKYCNNPAEFLARWNQCNHYGNISALCFECCSDTRYCPYCGASGRMTVLERL